MYQIVVVGGDTFCRKKYSLYTPVSSFYTVYKQSFQFWGKKCTILILFFIEIPLFTCFTHLTLLPPVSRHLTNTGIRSTEGEARTTWEESHSAHRVLSIDIWWIIVSCVTIFQTQSFTCYYIENSKLLWILMVISCHFYRNIRTNIIIKLKFLLLFSVLYFTICVKE